MTENRDAIKRKLYENDPDFRQLILDHQTLNRESDALSQHPILTRVEEETLHRIKRRKLLIRDRIEKRIMQVLTGSSR
ncbi:MAG TPA: YdcH family protein [bacterium]|nr:YdcH family protein [bacterium]